MRFLLSRYQDHPTNNQVKQYYRVHCQYFAFLFDHLRYEDNARPGGPEEASGGNDQTPYPVRPQVAKDTANVQWEHTVA